MKNNVICIFVDSVNWESVGTNRAQVSPTPFLDSLRKESVTASKLYSHGPYTDAAKKSLFTGRNCLDDFGYYFKMNTSPISDFKLFHDEGYETYGFYYPFWVYGDNVKKYIDHSIYTAGFIFSSEWNSNFKYYIDLRKERSLNSTEYKLIQNRINVIFDVLNSYLNDLLTKPEASLLYDKCLVDYDIKDALNRLETEKNLFISDANSYIDDLLTKGENHPLWKIDTTRIDKIIDGKFLNSISEENKDFFSTIHKNNIRANLLKLFPSPKRLIYGVIKYLRTKNKFQLYFLKNYFALFKQIKDMQQRWGNSHWQNDNSIHSILQCGIKLIQERNLGKDKPFYMNLNTDDPHQRLAMFAYDIQDREEVNDELKVLKEYVDKLGTKFKGSLLYLLSLRYVDYEIEKFCNQLKSLNLWDNTTLLVLSDHGSSFTYTPLHNQPVNCFDEECYHIPVLLRHPGFEGVEVSSYNNSKDIFPTVCDLVGISPSPFFKGRSMLNALVKDIPYVMTEYMGPGCPDLTSRRMWLSIRDKNYIIAYKVGIFENFEDGELCEVYDLKSDPNGYYNIAQYIEKKKIEYLLVPLKDRYKEIKKDTYEILEKINNEDIVLPIN